MNIFPIRRRDALSELKLPDASFDPLDDAEAESAQLPQPEEYNPVSPANELATSIVEQDIVEAVRADNPPPPDPIELPAPLSQRHLQTIDRMVAHLKTDERRLEQQIHEAKKRLADTQLVRQGYELNGANLRHGIAVLSRLANTRVIAPRRKKVSSPAVPKHLRQQPRPTDDMDDVVTSKPRGRGGKAH